ncbi:hypothetical protein HDF12_001098 [Edaphobacter lichenicola]|uniref:Uncharacterized protein n=1 Tax=Tunturiibacter lichenicola TaxID=2051959 RepID=A0A7Y9NK10_9BACT|nr:hypothetical protein [Edaphobacter lichenicola]
MAEQRKYERGIIAGRDKLVADSTETGDRHENTANAPTARPIVGKHWRLRAPGFRRSRCCPLELLAKAIAL